MAGEVQVQWVLTADDVAAAKAKGFGVDVLLDLSHNAHTTTTDPTTGTQVMAKEIELDVTVKRGDPTDRAFYDLGSEPSGSFVFALFTAIVNVGGWSALNSRNIKVEFPQFDASIFDPTQPATYGPEVGDAYVGCSTPAANFNALPAHQRNAFGMYRWTGAYQYAAASQLAGG